MKLKVLGSGSSGNCYILKPTTGKSLVIEAGVKWQEVKRVMDFNVGDIEACLISHIHGDHAAYAKDFLAACVTVAASEETIKAGKWPNKFFQRQLKNHMKYRFGDYSVYVFDLRHDVPCIGFIIGHKEMGRLAFITDTLAIPYRLPKVDHWLIEANYDADILQENIGNGVVPPSMKDRLLLSHMELYTTIEALRVNDLSETKDIMLIHLSGRNSDAKLFMRKVQEATGKPVYIAKKGLVIDISK